MKLLRVASFALALSLAVLSSAGAEEPLGGLRRHAAWQGRFEEPSAGRAGVRVVALDEGSALRAAGFEAGDVLLRIDGRLLGDAVTWNAAQAAARGGEGVRVEADRAGRRVERVVTLPAAALESWPGVETRYESVLSERGLRQRLLVTRPSGAGGRLPAILFVPWLSCDTVEVRADDPHADPINPFLLEIGTRSGWVLARIEKPGVGDSEGVCGEADFATEHAGQRAALGAVRRHPWVDPGRVVLMGQSYGGGILPLVAPGSQEGIAGYVVINSWVGTWLERLLVFERLRLEREGKAPAEATEEMRALSEIYAEYLLRGRTPGQVFAERPHLRRFWSDGDEHQYGRPAAFYQQIQALNLAAAWQEVEAPVLAVWGDRDFVMHRADHERLVAWANGRFPGSGELLVVPGADHGLGVTAAGSRRLAEGVVSKVLDWLARRVAR